LSESGYVQGRNLAVEYPSAEDHLNRLPALATDWFAVRWLLLRLPRPPRLQRKASTKATLAALAREQRSGLIVAPEGFTQVHRKLVLDLATRYQLSAIYSALSAIGKMTAFMHSPMWVIHSRLCVW
jgi:hypothetical protein